MNGMINIIKPPGMTSFDVVGFLRRTLNVKKAGHTGTLDPAACGVLPVCLGSATRAIEFLTDNDKKYRAELTLGIETDTQDSTGRVLSEKQVSLSDNHILDVVKSFVGKIEQVPPMYSAIKINGRKLYQLAREGVIVERKARTIQIHSIEVLQIRNNRVLFDVECSKGTYIRTLCADIGSKLGCGGHLSFLLRTKAGKFTLDTAVTLEKARDSVLAGRINEKLLGVDYVFSHLRKVILDDDQYKLFKNGGFLLIPDKVHTETNFHGEGDTILINSPVHESCQGNVCSAKEGDILRVYDSNLKFAALGEVVRKGKLYIKSKKQFI